jgi:hypothetical protein
MNNEKNIQVIIDSSTDIAPRLENRVHIVPLTLSFNGKEYLDGIDMSRMEFYEKLENEDVMPKTSQVTPAAFDKVFAKIQEKGQEAIVITVSSGLSGTWQSASLAAQEYPEIRVKFQKHAMVQEKPTAEQIEWAKKTMAKIEAGKSVANLDKKYAMEYTGMDYSALPELHDVEIQTVILGDFAMVALPFEVYSELGWRIREQSPYENTFVVGQANASYGYIGPGFIYGTSSYGARYSYYTARFSRGDLLVKYSVEMLKELKTAK